MHWTFQSGLTTKIHVVTSSAKTAVAFSLSPGNAHDAPEGQKLLANLKGEGVPLLMDRAYEGDKTREFVTKQGFVAVVPPKMNRRQPWAYDKKLYKSRNEVERFFLRIKPKLFQLSNRYLNKA
jgi:transposase